MHRKAQPVRARNSLTGLHLAVRVNDSSGYRRAIAAHSLAAPRDVKRYVYNL